jgi:hypothetical protein
MAKIKLLIDTDIIIDSLKGVKAAKDLFRTKRRLKNSHLRIGIDISGMKHLGGW